ncbi:3-hydroxyacyl-CoA dehydrogenase NAD-binding domain-containing protein [Salinicoccus albus]|uniref:3-hydroxyacyl-CoA dehydrogenase NAD-binding domain-containing protein n=1 Tax=Salinicoccus albus TaxID=418756 RepID=UPI00036E215C|nr:3-hydroxyacyl-CoA dehydrogenase NAD-binding domain-containing protein [Salinicoccus albus]
MEGQITVIGAGKMGLGIAQFFAQNDKEIVLVDLNERVIEEAPDKIKEELIHLVNIGILKEEKAKEILNRINFSSNLNDASSSKLIFEAIPEKLDLKRNLFNRLEKICDISTIFATNTSGISINEISTVLKRPERFIGAHFFMPAAIIPLIEVVKSDRTDHGVADYIITLFKTLGKEAVLVRKDIPGFIANRIQHAMAREAISLLEKGVASAEDIDTVIKWSLGIRMIFTGPLEQRDFNGLDIHSDIAAYLYEDLENRTVASPLLLQKVEKGEIGVKANKGFYEWDEDTKQQHIQAKNDALLKMIKYLEKESMNNNESNYKE